MAGAEHFYNVLIYVQLSLLISPFLIALWFCRGQVLVPGSNNGTSTKIHRRIHGIQLRRECHP